MYVASQLDGSWLLIVQGKLYAQSRENPDYVFRKLLGSDHRPPQPTDRPVARCPESGAAHGGSRRAHGEDRPGRRGRGVRRARARGAEVRRLPACPTCARKLSP